MPFSNTLKFTRPVIWRNVRIPGITMTAQMQKAPGTLNTGGHVCADEGWCNED
jgi:hypothetical protein